MNERRLRSMIDQVRAGNVSRRDFIRAMAGLGLGAPFASQLLAWSGVAQAQAKSNYKPNKRAVAAAR